MIEEIRYKVSGTIVLTAVPKGNGEGGEGGEEEEGGSGELNGYEWMWLYGDFPYPVERVDWGNTPAVWRVIETASVFLPVNTEGKPIFEDNIDPAHPLEVGTWVYGYREVLSGREADGQKYVIVLDPRGSAIPRSKVELVGIVTKGGSLIRA